VPRYGTIDYYQELKKLWDADELTVKLMKGLYTTEIIKISDKPEKKPIFIRIEDGKIVEIRRAEPDDKPELVHEASMEVWKNLLQYKIELTKALLLEKIKIAGARKMAEYMKGWMRIMDLQKRVPTEW